jgi:hypothetical protein
MLRSFFVFARNVDGREVFAIGEGVLPQGCRQLGCHESLSAALAHRDRLRLGQAMPTWMPATRPRPANAH